jgi:glycosyltransferase involved in cell wall biosynthesis
MKKISIVIPVYNEENFISGTLESISLISYPLDDYEVVVVTDGCTDGTVPAVKKFPFVRLVELDKNIGRYAARKTGAEAARYPNILFIDSRAHVDPNILSVIDQANAQVIQGVNFDIENPGLFETFYKSVRRKVFSKHYANSSQIKELNKDNFDSLPKGTNVFFVKKDLLFQAYEDLSGVDMSGDSSDDTKLIKTIVQRTPAIIHPDVKIIYFYRKSFLANASHLYGFNATSFIDYYFHPSQKYFWLVIILPLLALFGVLAGLLFIPLSLLIKVSILLGLDLIISIYLARSIRDLYIIMFMMPLCVSIFYAGIVRAIFLKYLKTLLNKQIQQ